VAVRLKRYRGETATNLGTMLHEAAREALEDPVNRFHPSALHGYGDDLNRAIERAGRAIAADEWDNPHTTGRARFVVQREGKKYSALGAATLDGSVTALRPTRFDIVPGVMTIRRLTRAGHVGLVGLNATSWVKPSAVEELPETYEKLRDYDPEIPLWAAEIVGAENRLAHAALEGAGFTPYLEPNNFDLGEDEPSPEMQLYVLPSRVKSNS
jgi:hypothetical protein